MTTYYYELENGNGELVANSDKEAIEKIKWRYQLLCVYKENENTPDGTPFIIIWEKPQPQVEKLLRAAHAFIYHFVDLEEAEINGFDADKWLDEVEEVLQLKEEFNGSS